MKGNTFFKDKVGASSLEDFSMREGRGVWDPPREIDGLLSSGRWLRGEMNSVKMKERMKKKKRKREARRLICRQ